MGTSNWQQIPFCIDALMKMEPNRVLDVGVGFGRWGMIVREFCDVWFSRIFKDDWKVQLEGIEAFPKSITDYHRHFYNQIHLGDAAEIIPTLDGPWSVTIYGDVLEHFTKEKAHELLNISLDRSDYVIVNIPIGEEHPQGEAYGNVYERHLSSWLPEDFAAFGLVRHVLLRDYIGRDYGSFVLSRRDPRNLRESLFSQFATYESRQASTVDHVELDVITRRIEEQKFEVSFLKNSAAYKLACKIRDNPVVRTLVDWKLGDRNLLSIKPLPAESGRQPEVWVLGVHAKAGEPGMPWDHVTTSGPFEARRSKYAAYGQCWLANGPGGEMVARTTSDPAVRLMGHVGSTRVQISFNGRTEIINLCTPGTTDVIVYPGRSPMYVPPAPQAVEAAPHEGNGRLHSKSRAAQGETVGAH